MGSITLVDLWYCIVLCCI